MKKKEAYKILIQASINHIKGAGCGIAVTPKREEKIKIREAIYKLQEEYPNSLFFNSNDLSDGNIIF